MTLRSGLHYGVEADDYYADPCEEPSLTQSIAKIMLRQSPAHARLAHPRLNPGKEERDPTKYDIGHIAHRLLLGRGREVEIIDAKDWRTKGAKEAREVAREAGRLGVLSQDWDRASDMTGAVLAQLRERGYGPDWEGLDVERCAEVVAIAHPGSWLRCMIDWLPSLTSIWDLKSTGRSAAPDELWRHLVDADWPVQAAMHERILDYLDPGGAGRRAHRFIVVENSPPYALSIVRMSETHMTFGRHQLDRAEVIWAACMAADRWPAYPIIDQNPEVPAWKLKAEMLEAE